MILLRLQYLLNGNIQLSLGDFKHFSPVGLLASNHPALCNPLTAQETGPLLDENIRVEVDLVTVRFTVKDAEGNLVNDLEKDDFRVFENGDEWRLWVHAVHVFSWLCLKIVPIIGAVTPGDKLVLRLFKGLFCLTVP